MTSPLDTVPATQLEIFGTREMITALGKALIKKGVISHSDVVSELSAKIPSHRAIRTAWLPEPHP
jgi:hypothetical protein